MKKIIIQQLSLLLFALTFILLIASCKKDHIDKDNAPINIQMQLPIKQADQQRTDFAKLLAKALTDIKVRRFLKEEALKKFDNDYDILFQSVKDKKVNGEVSFLEHLTSISGYENDLASISKSVPLLTIAIPELSNFTAEKWDVNKQIPLVTVVNSDHDEESNTKLIAFDYLGNQYQLTSDKEPDLPVIVVKDNERIITMHAMSQNSQRSFIKETNFILEDSGNSFYFMDDCFNGKVTKKSTNTRMPFNPDPKLKAAYDLGAASQRDYVYYDILNPTDEGKVNWNYVECLYGFALSTQGSLNIVANNDPLNDWTDGGLEFQVDLLFFDGKGVFGQPLTKIFGVLKSELIGKDKSLLYYYFPEPINLVTWDLQRSGDTWKYVVHEIDPDVQMTETSKISSKFGSNWKADAAIPVTEAIKIGFGVGGDQSETFENSVEYKVSAKSNACGEAVVNFVQPVMVDKWIFTIPMLFNDITWESDFGEDLNTGTVRLMIAPKSIN